MATNINFAYIIVIRMRIMFYIQVGFRIHTMQFPLDLASPLNTHTTLTCSSITRKANLYTDWIINGKAHNLSN